MKVAGIIVTRGDHNLDLREHVLPSLPDEWDVLVWDNGDERIWWRDPEGSFATVADLSVYGRYAAIQYTTADLIYVQDDDCVVTDPQALVVEWEQAAKYPWDGRTDEPWGSDPRDAVDFAVCNMPEDFRHDFYEHHSLVGFGAVFHRDAPSHAFVRLAEAMAGAGGIATIQEEFNRTCDIVFTALTPCVLVDVEKENLDYAYHYDRMYRQPQHQAERARMLEFVKPLI